MKNSNEEGAKRFAQKDEIVEFHIKLFQSQSFVRIQITFEVTL